jgi:hypothetical protein
MGSLPLSVPVLLKKARPLPPDVEITLAELMKKARPLPPAVEIVLAELLQIRPCGLSDK